MFLELSKFNISLAKLGEPIQLLLDNRQRWTFAFKYSYQMTQKQVDMYFASQKIFLGYFEYLAIINLTIEKCQRYEKPIQNQGREEQNPNKNLNTNQNDGFRKDVRGEGQSKATEFNYITRTATLQAASNQDVEEVPDIEE
jgi:hypothetical protein